MLRKQLIKEQRCGSLRRAPALGAGTAVILALVACGGDTSPEPTTGNVDFGSMTMDELYEGAKEEGTVVFYGATGDELDVLAAPFRENYPGIEIRAHEQQGEDAAALMSEEANAGVYTVDVLDTEQNTIYAISQLDLLAEYSPPEAADFDERLKWPFFSGYRIQVKTLSYNTELVSEAEAPRDYDDLLDPKWSGMICAESSEISVFGLMVAEWGEDQAVEYWGQLMSNGLRFVSGQTNLVQSIIAGDCPIAVTANSHTVLKEADAGAPITYVETDPIFCNYGAIGIAAQAPHPYAARLWANYLMSPEGQQSVADAWRLPANPAVPHRHPDLRLDEFNMSLAAEEIMKKAPELNTLYYEATDRPVVGS